MLRRIGVYGVTETSLRLLPALARNPELDLQRVFDPAASTHRRRLALLEPDAAAVLQRLLTDDPGDLAADPPLDAVVDAGIDPPFARRFPALVARGIEVLTPAQAAARWDTPPEAASRGAELLHALGEIADALELGGAPEALFERLLEAALAATGASGGSLLWREPGAETLGVRAAIGLEPELWSKVQVGLGAGIAGRAWAEGRSLLVIGRASPERFDLSRPRFDVAAALAIPLVDGGAVHGVLNLHDASRSDCFRESDLAFADTLGAVVGRIGASAERTRLARQQALAAQRCDAVAAALAGSAPLELRLARLCQLAAAQAGRGVATLWWRDDTGTGEPGLRLAATSLAGGALGPPARLAPGEGLDGRAAAERRACFVRHEGRIAYAALPLLDGAALLGVLAVQAGPEALAAGDAEAALASIAAAAAAQLARENDLAAARERAVASEALHEAAQQLLAGRDPDAIAAALAASATLHLDAEDAIVRVLDPEHRRLRVRGRAGAEAGALDDALVALDRRAARAALAGETLSDAGDERAFLTVPIQHAGRTLGTLGVYGRRGGAAFGFGAPERARLARLAAYAGRALVDALPAELPVDAPGARLLEPARFARRVEDELARAAEAAGAAPAFALVSCRIEDWSALEPPVGEALARTAATALAAQLRVFDVAARVAPDLLLALLPEPGLAPAERIARLARAVAEAVAKQNDDDGRPALVFGHALHPGDGDTRAALVARAREPRIRML